jgi:hypothetical protein
LFLVSDCNFLFVSTPYVRICVFISCSITSGVVFLVFICNFIGTFFSFLMLLYNPIVIRFSSFFGFCCCLWFFLFLFLHVFIPYACACVFLFICSFVSASMLVCSFVVGGSLIFMFIYNSIDVVLSFSILLYNSIVISLVFSLVLIVACVLLGCLCKFPFLVCVHVFFSSMFAWALSTIFFPFFLFYNSIINDLFLFMFEFIVITPSTPFFYVCFFIFHHWFSPQWSSTCPSMPFFSVLQNVSAIH